MWWFIFPRFGGVGGAAADPGTGPTAFGAEAVDDGQWTGAAAVDGEWSGAEPVTSVGA
jgi:hypothetical protein